MPHRRPVQITTTTHAMVITWYATMVGLGLLHVTGAASHDGMLSVFGPTWTSLWAMTHVLAALLALAGALGSKFLANPTNTLWVEAVGVGGLVVVSACYIIGLTSLFGTWGVLATQLPQWSSALGGTARVIQIAYEAKKVRTAVAKPMPASPPPLAEADE